MGVNKVEYYGETLIDISDSTVTAGSLAKGATAYSANGERIVGTMEITKDNVTTALGYTPVKSVNGKTGESISLNANDVGAVSTANYLTGDKYYYVNAETGSDSNTGTNAKPFQSLQKAIDSIPNNLGGKNVLIYLMSSITLADGESINCTNKHNGNITIRSDLSEKPSITGNTNVRGTAILNVKECGANFKWVNIDINQLGNSCCMYFENNSAFMNVSGAAFNGAKGTGIQSAGYSGGMLVYSPMLVRLADMNFNNCLGTAIYCNTGIVLMQNTNNITDCDKGIVCSGGLVIGRVTLNNIGTNYETNNGGRIYANGQTSVPNY